MLKYARVCSTAMLVGVLLVTWGCTPPKAGDDEGSSATANGPMADFGEPARLTDADTIPVAHVIEDPKSYEGKYVRLQGEVVGVCAKKGCWIRMSPAGEHEPNVFVKFTCPVGGRLIPMEAEGKEAIVEGTLMVEVVSEDEARHYAEDAGRSPEEIAKIVGEQHRLRLASPAARVMGVEAPPAEEGSTTRPTTRPASS